MPLTAGARLGPYDIVGLAGAGGMGEVYRARDPRLGRDVAVKTLPATFTADPDRLRRFEQEARATAALNHPNILVVYDTGVHEGTPYVVSELLEGTSLRERLQPEPGSAAALPVRKAIDIAIQVAHGLAAAHGRQIVHRDLKPENLFITADGHVKILDFGLAKLTQPDAGMSGDTTIAGLRSEPGMVLGTVGYMAPEQVRGQTVDHRADIFAFGVVLYEMLAGRRAFVGATAADTIAAVVKEDPPDLPIVERHIPPALARIVDRCLEKNPSARFQTASDLAFALEALSGSSDRTEVVAALAEPAKKRASGERVAWVVAALASLSLVAAAPAAIRHLRESSAPADLVSFVVLPPENGAFITTSPPVVSPDGRAVVFNASADGVNSLWFRALSAVAATRLPGTTNANWPFWSPDSDGIGFVGGGKLQTLRIRDGQPDTLPTAVADATGPGGAAWSSEGTILFAPQGYSPLHKVSASGGAPAPVTTLADGEVGHRWPVFLPDGRSFLFVALDSVGATSGTLWRASLDSPARTHLGTANSHAEYASGHLLFARAANLVAQPFDAARNVTSGDPILLPIAFGFGGSGTTVRGQFSASRTGVLAYRTGSSVARAQLTWLDRSGRPLGTVGDSGFYLNLGLRSDDGRLAVSQATGTPVNMDVWLLDLTRNAAPVRLTSAPGGDFDPFWSPDSTEVFFTSNRDNSWGVYRRAANSSGDDVLVAKMPIGGSAGEWSPDGRFLVYTAQDDIWMMPTQGDRTPVRFFASGFAESSAAVSPDGRWLAYTSNESGRPEVHVQPFPRGGGKTVVSREGGNRARWRGDGRELFFLAPDGTLMAAAVETTGEFQAALPLPLFRTPIRPSGNNRPFAVARDGQRFLMPVPVEKASDEMIVVLNWTRQIGR